MIVMPQQGDVMPEDTTEETTVRPFAVFLQDHRDGSLHAEITDSLNALVDLVNELRKPGELTIKIKVTPVGSTQMQVTDSVTVKEPQPDPQVSIYFVDKAKNLTRNDPAQMSFGDLREVPKPDTGEMREVGGE